MVLDPSWWQIDLHIRLDHTEAGNYSFDLIDISGKILVRQNATIAGNDYNTDINTSILTKGFYLLQIMKDDAQHILPIVKE